MDFRPINSDHAVQSASFIVLFDGILGAAAIQTLRGRRDLVGELPAIQVPEIYEIRRGGPSKPQHIGGIQLSHLRPDGTAAWALRVVAGELTVECGRYTRWYRVWETAKKYLVAGLELAQESGRKVSTVGLTVNDVFVANQKEYDLKTLLRPGHSLADRIFSAGPTWHNHLGWFEGRAEYLDAHWLNQLNVDAARTPEDLRVSISHNQELRLDSPVAFPMNKIDEIFFQLHLNNKRVLTELLQPEITEKIGLKSQ